MKEIDITFVRDYEVKDGSGTRYRQGQVARLSEPSAHHFIVRGAAVAGKGAGTPGPQMNLEAPSSEPPRAADGYVGQSGVEPAKPRARKTEK